MNLGDRQANAVFIERFLDEIGFANSARECFDADKKFMRSINIIKKLGSGENQYGDAYLVCKPNKFYTSTTDLCQVTFSLKSIAPTTSANEVFAMKLFYEDVMSNMYPNLPILYGYRMCSDCTFPSAKMMVAKKGGDELAIEFDPFRNKIPARYTKTHEVYTGGKTRCSVLLTEYALYGDLEHFFKNNKTPADVSASLFFQLLTSIYFIQSNYAMEHNDLHQGNVLVHAVKSGGVWEYVIDGVHYYCNNYGYLAVLWDFGFAMYPNNEGHVYFPNEFIDTDGYVEGRVPGKNGDVLRVVDTFAYYRQDIRIPEVEDVLSIVTEGEYDVSAVLAKVYRKYTEPSGNVVDTFFTSDLQPLEWYYTTSNDDIKRLSRKLPVFMLSGFTIHKKWSVASVDMFKHNLIDFKLLSCVVDNDDVVRKYIEWFDPRLLSRSRHMPYEFIEERATELDWVALSYFGNLSENICKKFKTRVVWEYVTDDDIETWSVSTLVLVANYLRWDKLVLANRSAEEISQLQTYVDWNMISTHYPITPHFAAMFRHHLVPELVSVNKQADHDAVFNVAPELVRWDMVSPVTIAQLRVHATDVDWTVVSQSIDMKHVDEFVPYIHWESFWSRNDITPEIISQYKEYLVAHTLVGPLKVDTSRTSEPVTGLANLSVAQLKEMARNAGVGGYYKLKKAELLAALSGATNVAASTNTVCRGTTKAGKQCKKKSVNMGYCGLHGGQARGGVRVGDHGGLAEYINWAEYDCSLMTDAELDSNTSRINWGKSCNYTKLVNLDEKLQSRILGSTNFDWAAISHYPLPSHIVAEYASEIKWDIFCNAGVSADVLIEYRDEFSMKDLTNYAGFRIFDYIRFDDIDWANVSRFPDLPKEHARALHRVLDLSLLSYKDFDWEFIRKHEDEVNWDTISKLPDLPKTFVQVYFDRLV
jgi:serine/threonine protein kinase